MCRIWVRGFGMAASRIIAAFIPRVVATVKLENLETGATDDRHLDFQSAVAVSPHIAAA
jgi:hypothetical protein